MLGMLTDRKSRGSRRLIDGEESLVEGAVVKIACRQTDRRQ